MNPTDHLPQRILWRLDISQPFHTYELSTVSHRLATASFLATRTLQQLVDDEGNPSPTTHTTVKKNVYIYNPISADKSIEEAIQLHEELTSLLQQSGFWFPKLCSNSLPVLAGQPPDLLGTQSSLKFDPE